jgi:hypothetical protein
MTWLDIYKSFNFYYYIDKSAKLYLNILFTTIYLICLFPLVTYYYADYVDDYWQPMRMLFTQYGKIMFELILDVKY